MKAPQNVPGNCLWITMGTVVVVWGGLSPDFSILFWFSIMSMEHFYKEKHQIH